MKSDFKTIRTDDLKGNKFEVWDVIGDLTEVRGQIVFTYLNEYERKYYVCDFESGVSIHVIENADKTDKQRALKECRDILTKHEEKMEMVLNECKIFIESCGIQMPLNRGYTYATEDNIAQEKNNKVKAWLERNKEKK